MHMKDLGCEDVTWIMLEYGSNYVPQWLQCSEFEHLHFLIALFMDILMLQIKTSNETVLFIIVIVTFKLVSFLCGSVHCTQQCITKFKPFSFQWLFYQEYGVVLELCLVTLSVSLVECGRCEYMIFNAVRQRHIIMFINFVKIQL